MNIIDVRKTKLSKDRPKMFAKTFEKAWPLVEKNCSNILSTYKETGNVLFRGVTGKTNTAKLFLGQSRNDRKPIASSNEIYAQICDLYLKLAGFTALRGNSTFCNSDYDEVMWWGDEVYIIFPINGFTYGYSRTRTNIPASDYKYQSNVVILYTHIDYHQPLPFTNKELLKQATKFVAQNNIKNTQIEDALDYAKDIWIHGRYIAFSYQNYAARISKALGINLNSSGNQVD